MCRTAGVRLTDRTVFFQPRNLPAHSTPVMSLSLSQPMATARTRRCTTTRSSSSCARSPRAASYTLAEQPHGCVFATPCIAGSPCFHLDTRPFAVPAWLPQRCEIVDKHLGLLAQKHIEVWNAPHRWLVPLPRSLVPTSACFVCCAWAVSTPSVSSGALLEGERRAVSIPM